MNTAEILKLASSAFAIMLTSGSTNAANFVVNGGFESPVILVGDPYLLTVTPTGWIGTADIVAQSYGSVNSGDGDQWLDLNPGTAAGTGISQAIILATGMTYDFSFVYNGGGGGTTTEIAYSISTDAGNLLAGSVATSALNVYSGTPWAHYNGSFTAPADTVATLSFQPNGSWSGGFIDAVTLTATAVPEPSHTGTAVAGVASLFVVWRRRFGRYA